MSNFINNKVRSQLDYVVDRCVTAMDASMPIIFLETEDMTLLDRLLRSEKVIPYWSHDASKDSKFEGWEEMRELSREEHERPANIKIFSKRISNYFDDINTADGKTYASDTFVAEHQDFQYFSTKVGHNVPRIIACRNFINDDSSAQHLQRLVSEHISAFPHDGILRHFIILQAPVVDIPVGIGDYVEVITVPALSDDEIKNIISEFANSNDDDVPYEQLLDKMIVSLRGFTLPKINELLYKIYSVCGSISRNVYSNDVSVEEVAGGIVTGEKKQMLQKTGLLRAREIGKKEAAGLDCIKTWISCRKQLIENSLDAKREWGIDAPKGVLISGIPGTGKSLLAEEVSRLLDVPLVQMDMGSIRNKYQGESERNMRRVIHLAESLAPCVLWIDEIEKAFSGVKGSGDVDGGTTMRIFASFLTWMQEKQSACFIFATANDVSTLPPELLRRGRFDQKFYTFMPTKKECISILRACIEGKNGVYRELFDPDVISEKFLDDFLGFCGENEKFLTGADIEGIVSDAKAIVYFNTTSDSTQIGKQKYAAPAFKKALQEAVLAARPYGETNKEDIVKCLLSLARNRFAPSSSTNIIDMDDVDVQEMTIKEKIIESNHYDELLLQQIRETLEEMNKKTQHSIN